eukprot:Polyplicarium_translucidae@DN3360_c0_g7_i1.p1
MELHDVLPLDVDDLLRAPPIASLARCSIRRIPIAAGDGLRWMGRGSGSEPHWPGLPVPLGNRSKASHRTVARSRQPLRFECLKKDSAVDADSSRTDGIPMATLNPIDPRSIEMPVCNLVPASRTRFSSEHAQQFGTPQRVTQCT